MDIGKIFTLFLERLVKAQRGYEDGELKNVVTAESLHHHNFIKGKYQGLKEAEKVLVEFAIDIGLTASSVPVQPSSSSTLIPSTEEKDAK